MVERISDNKNQVLEYMKKDLEKYGPDKMDVAEIGKLADIVKDLAEAEKACWEAEYYRSVTEAMGNGTYGYDGMMHNQPNGRYGYRDSMGRYARRGYNSYGYHETLDSLRGEMESASPEEREKIKREIRQIAEM